MWLKKCSHWTMSDYKCSKTKNIHSILFNGIHYTVKIWKKTIIALLRKTCIINCQLGDLPHLRQTKYTDTSIPLTTFIHHLHWFRGYPPSLKIISGILIYLGHIASGNLRPRLSVTRGKQPIYDTAPQVDPCSQVKYHLPFTFIML